MTEKREIQPGDPHSSTSGAAPKPTCAGSS